MVERFGQGTRYHEAVRCGEILFLSGITATEAGDSIRLQAEEALKKVDAMLERCGSDRDHMLRAEIYVRDQADVADFNEVWDAWIHRDTAPARYLVVSQLGRPAIRVEIVITAAVLPACQ